MTYLYDIFQKISKHFILCFEVYTIGVIAQSNVDVRKRANVAVVEDKFDVDLASVEVEPHFFLELHNLFAVRLRSYAFVFICNNLRIHT